MCGVARRVASGCVSGRRRGRGFESCLGGFSLARRPVLDASLSRSVVFWTASVEPVPLERPTAFLTAGVFYDRGSGLPRGQQSSIFSLLPTSGVYPQSLSVCLSSLSLYRPSPNKRSCVSSGSHLVCLNCGFNKNSKDFLRR